MFLPDKYTTLTESYIGLSALVFDIMRDEAFSIEDLWREFSKKYKRTA